MVTNSGRKKRLIIMFTLTFLYMIAELVVGYWGDCTSLLTDAFHMLSDVIALVIGFTAIHLSPKKWEKNTFGWARTEVLGALVNAVFLLALCFTIIMESIQKFVSPKALEKLELILIVGGGGLFINLLGLCIFHEGSDSGHQASSKVVKEEQRGSLIQNQNRLTRIIVPKISNTNDGNEMKRSDDLNAGNVLGQNEEVEALQNPPPTSGLLSIRKTSRKSMNMRSVFLHLMADTANSVVVIVAAGASYLVKKYVGKDYNNYARWKWINYLDPTLSVTIVFLICLSTWPLLQETSLILLQNVPPHLSVKLLKEQLLNEVSGISGIHEFHVWQLAGDKFYASVHVKCNNVSEYERISKEIKSFFHRQGIYETTIQTEIESLSMEARGSDSCLVTIDAEPEESKSIESP